ncbi:hypothetical protein F4801DRAFT_579023 [Xylaria longipes]|nr:hypothetical protein F4801DRAFT_579023 [Xylaria longipes]
MRLADNEKHSFANEQERPVDQYIDDKVKYCREMGGADEDYIARRVYEHLDDNLKLLSTIRQSPFMPPQGQQGQQGQQPQLLQPGYGATSTAQPAYQPPQPGSYLGGDARQRDGSPEQELHQTATPALQRQQHVNIWYSRLDKIRDVMTSRAKYGTIIVGNTIAWAKSGRADPSCKWLTHIENYYLDRAAIQSFLKDNWGSECADCHYTHQKNQHNQL